MSIDSSLGSTEPAPVAVESGSDTSAPTKALQMKNENKHEKEHQQSTLSPTSILSSLCAPFSNLLSGSTTSTRDSSPQPPESANKPATITEVNVNDEKEGKEPEPYYKPNEVPTFKTLQKKRLSGTRTKQLLRAAGRAYNDPPPPPELGTCCGSSCDPCVTDLWREERDIWRERWGDRRVEDGHGEGRKELEW
ncbi:hypothetical protein N7486_007560 [Penicillium sp. IBT 16267x]|nr:hypothetical protein N7486_007560 [Penicillium sp. IBT 16267x]